MEVIARYAHPQGSTIEVYDNGTVVKRRPDGTTARTSATAEKLAAGYGGWTRIADIGADYAATPRPASAQLPGRVLRPMRFQEADMSTLPGFVGDGAWALQQKVDGIRAQLVVDPGTSPWFRNSSGGVVSNSTATPAVHAILRTMSAAADGETGYCIDGELLNGTFHVFDLVMTGQEALPLITRLEHLRAWTAIAGRAQPRLGLLPTATTKEAKQRLVRAVYDAGGEGWIAKRLDGGYDWDARVQHSLKLKITHTVDAVVSARNQRGKQNMTLSVYNDLGTLVEIGSASAIGKPDAAIGQVVEVRYLYAGAEGRLVQPTVLRVRHDKLASECRTDQLHFVSKHVVQIDPE